MFGAADCVEYREAAGIAPQGMNKKIPEQALNTDSAVVSHYKGVVRAEADTDYSERRTHQFR
jgi:hypothetical protein